MTVRTRFAPSPTGVLHIGSVRTALFCWLYARHCDGEFVLRIEDTDRERSTKENVEAILDGMAWLGLDPDDGPHYQTNRLERYSEVSQQLIDSGAAYRCYCTKEELAEVREEQQARGAKSRYDGRCRHRTEPRAGVDPVIRFRNPDRGTVTVNDLVRGEVVFDNAELDDLVIIRSDGIPTYNFSVVVDDSDMAISHVIRGDDHLNNTPRQLNILSALGLKPPSYAHLPMILGPDGSKLSKRHGAVDIRDYRDGGFLPEALLNYLVRLGWSYGDQEIFTVGEMTDLFDLAGVNQSASTFNPEKLMWVNQQHMMARSAEELAAQLVPFLEREGYDLSAGPAPVDVASAFHERAETLVEMAEKARFCYEDFDAIDPNVARKVLRPVVLEPLKRVHAQLEQLVDWNIEAIDSVLKGVADDLEIGLGKLGQPLRVAVTGGTVSPPIDVTIFLVGQARALERIGTVIEFVVARAAAN